MNFTPLRKNFLSLYLISIGIFPYSCENEAKQNLENTIPRKKIYIFVDSYHLNDEGINELRESLITSLDKQKSKVTALNIELLPLNCETINSNSLASFEIDLSEAEAIKNGSFTTFDKVKRLWEQKINALTQQTPGCNKIIDSFYRLKDLSRSFSDTSYHTKILYITNWLEIDTENNVSEDQYRFLGTCSSGICELDEAALDEAIKSLNNKESKLFRFSNDLGNHLEELDINSIKIYYLSSNSLKIYKDGNADMKLNYFWDNAFKKAKLERIRINSINEFLD